MSARYPLLVYGFHTMPADYTDGIMRTTNVNGAAVALVDYLLFDDMPLYNFPDMGFPSGTEDSYPYRTGGRDLVAGLRESLGHRAARAEVERTADQRIQLDLSLGTRLDINFNDAPIVRHILGLPMGTISLTTASPRWISPGHIRGLVQPRNGTLEDIRSLAPLTIQRRPDVGPPQTIWLACQNEFSVSLRLDGFPRGDGSSYTEYHQGLAMVEEMMKGGPVRFFPDITNTSPYSASNRFGFHHLRPLIDTIDLSPEDGDWAHHWRLSFQAIEEVPP